MRDFGTMGENGLTIDSTVSYWKLNDLSMRVQGLRYIISLFPSLANPLICTKNPRIVVNERLIGIKEVRKKVN
jgi:hypothetical protein